MPLKNITHVTVVGAGIMGRQIALNAAQHEFSVALTDTMPEALAQAQSWVADYLHKAVEKGKMSAEDAQAAQARMRYTAELAQAMENCDLVIEAIVEKEDIKRKLFMEIDKLVSKDTIIATNSSYIPSSAYRNDISNPERLINLHYFNPAVKMELVEIVAGEHTAPQVVQSIQDFAKKIGKQSILVHKEVEGFVVNRLLKALQNEAYYLLENGVASFEDIDIGAEKGLRHPMGPFRLMDMTGLDLNYYNRQRVYEATGRAEDMPPKSLTERFLAGNYGRKTGKGWYDYQSEKKVEAK